MTDASDWISRVGKSWAYEWERTDRSFAPLTQRLFDVADSSSFARALDIGCGAGELTLQLGQARAKTRVTGVDISEDLVAVARERCSGLANVRIEQADAARWNPPKGEAPDLLVSRHGVMFFDDPVGAFSHIASQAAPAARLVFSCFRTVGENGWVRELATALPPGAAPAGDPNAPGPFAFGNRERVEGILNAAGWRDIGFEAFNYPMVGGAGDQAVEDGLSYFLRIGPAARAVAMLEGAEREQTIDRLRGVIERHHADGIVALPSAAWIVTARAPA
ncbi:class I SAM-dependent methyltransferase [Erythrobacter mangrovi]|uniref:Methyltransferase domain-containing protein n=1 Tax=Erythrobacter mangrovi TaxID=2739433 RepID=A0A7D3XI61_9SPHN|nr:class I SAM-dependent methyltransferase [Erythrobacter mangrovi]QKG71853.1 methyltransferase domain-containing protein [Erythrobacter mangrovi]